ncbi:hypothetical protein BDQ12DRAFT_695097 [Crucibulum laeve]|uniref:Cytochrome b561 domain-containing protein n=1 Tax=Crucibulum laeve TaxID=68775 RepID=A0A5C3MJ06_9AGAR|nr:hypothetical protein BDQ12DRAFT_695097 [Crucibulum laeve]
MCISATVNGSSVEYVLSSTGKQSLGWMGMGFGRQMANTPMVIMWPNADGGVTISQRSASQEVMPTVDSNPPRVAEASQALSVTSGSTPQLVYTIPANSDTKQFVIYAFSTQSPGSSAKDAPLVQHVDFGTTQLDLTKVISSTSGSSPNSTAGSPTSDDTSGVDDTLPLLPYQRVIIAHAIFCVVGFLLLLPVGALLARYLRTFTPVWFKGHWIIQFALAGPVIIVGVALGIVSVNKAGAPHLNDDHKRWGIGIFILYLIQCALGAVIHFVKPKQRLRRPPQNYIHAVFGLLIISLGLYQVHSGYDDEWPKTTGRGNLPKGVNVIFWIWVALLPLSYLAGLAFLRRQLRQEAQGKMVTVHSDENEEDIDMASVYRDHPR